MELLNEDTKKMIEQYFSSKMKIVRETLDEYVVALKRYCIPAAYGAMFQNKLIEMMKTLTPVKNKRGDASICDKIFLEVKLIFCFGDESIRFTNIRPFQDFDYFVICVCFGNLETGGANIKYYCIPKDVIINCPYITISPMQGTKEENLGNKNATMATTFGQNKLKLVFDNNNVLGGTTYDDLEQFIDEKYFELAPTLTSLKQNKVNIPVPTMKVAQPVLTKQIRYIVDNELVYGVNNQDALNKLLNRFGYSYGYYDIRKINSIDELKNKIKIITKKDVEIIEY